MSQADELLRNLTDEQMALYSGAGSGVEEPHIVIGRDRYIVIPESLKKIAVEHDHNIETVTFKCPRYWDEHDLSKLILYINYRLPNGEIGSYIAKNINVVDDNSFTFTWTIRREVTKYKGNISFLVCAKSTELEGDEALEILHWNTELCTDIYISEGLEAEAPLEEEYPDIVTQLLERMTEIDKYVTDNFSDIIIETSHSVNSHAEIDCCLKGQKIVGGNILGAEPQIVQGKNLCPTPEYKYEEDQVCVCVPNEDGTFNYTGLDVTGITLPGVELSQGTYCFSASDPIFTLFVPSIRDSGGPVFIEPGRPFSIAVEKDTAYITVWDHAQEMHTLENSWVQIEKGVKATPFVKYTKPQLYLPHNPIIHFSPTNPIKNRTFIGDGITIEQAGTALHYAFAGNYSAAFNENSTQIEVGQEYIMRFDVTCTYQNNPSKWGFGVFSKKQYSGACNVATKSLMTVKKGGTGEIVYQFNPQSVSYTDFSKSNLMINGKRYIIEFVFTSSYSGEVYFGMRSEDSPITVDLMSCLFCKTESLAMLVDQKINTNLLRIGNIYDSIDLATGQKIQQIMMDELSFEEEQLEVNNYIKALPSIPAYFVSGTLEDSDWIECVTPAPGTNNYTLTQPLSKGYIIYATRTPVTEQLELALPVVCTDEFEVYTSSDDNMVPYFQTSVDTKKSANSYLKKILNTIISMGGNI